MNIKNAKEVRRKIEEVKNKRSKKQKACKFKKFIVKFIVVEYILFIFFMACIGQVRLIKELKEKDNLILMQQVAIYKLSQTYEDSLQPIFSGDTITIMHNTFKSPKNAFEVSASDRELIAKLLYHEARGESVETQRAVVSVILNRLQSGKWGKTISDVVYAKNQFEPVSRGLLPNTKPLQTQYDVVDYVLETGTTVPSWVQYFRASYHFGWKNYTQYKALDNTYFGGFYEG